MAKTIAVIDGNSLMHRAYHAVPPYMTAPDGTPTNACFGFLNMLLKFIDEAQPDAVVCAFDAGKPAFRMEMIEQYKAQRPPMDQELRVQFPLMEDLLRAMDIPVVKMPGWEGDDILGTIARRDEELGYRTLLVTGDKDACQLATDLTQIVTTKKGVSDITISGPAEVTEKYGVTPEQFPDFLGLMGDSSDNIPGVPGIGQKTAAKLLERFGSMEGIYQNLDQLKGKQLENLRDNHDLALASRRVATIITDVELDADLDLEELRFPSFDPDTVKDAFSKLKFNAHLARVLQLVGARPASAELSWLPVLRGADAAAALDAALAEGVRVGVSVAEHQKETLFDTETSVTLAVACEGAGTALFQGEDAESVLTRIVREGAWAAADCKAALHHVYPRDCGKETQLSPEEILDTDCFDVSLAGYVLDSNMDGYGQAALLQRFCNIAFPEISEEAAAESCADGAAGAESADELRVCLEAASAQALVAPLVDALDKDGSRSVYEQIDLPLIGVLACMERVGAALDTEKLAELGRSTQAEIDGLRTQIYELAGEEFNVDSPKQLGHILFEVLGLPAKKKTQRGYSTDASVLTDLAVMHELPALVLKYREYAKIKSTYIDALPRLRAEGDGRVHSSFNQMVTTTGRLSSSDPNLQNIPVRTEFGRQIRTCFVPLKPGHVFLSADYSQIELRLLAHLSADEGLIAAFQSGQDFHAQTAAQVFGLPVEEITPELRSRAKAVNFGIVYGQQAYGLSQSLGIPFGEAKDMIDTYFEVYPDVREYLDRTVEQAKANGYAETMFGRKRHIAELRAANANMRGFGERTAMNHPMQGSAADIIKLAMRTCQERVLREFPDARLILQVHDELDFSVPAEQAEALGAMVKETMESAVVLRVPLIADVTWASTWAEAH